jgi:predicted dehydrogenase
MPGFLQVLHHIRACRFGAVEHVTAVYTIPIPALATGPHRSWMFTGPEKLLLEIGPHPLSTIYRLLGKTLRATADASGELTLANGSRFFHSWHNSLVCERGTAQFLLSVGKSYPNTWIHILCEDGEALVDFRRYTVRFSERTKYRRTNDLRDGSRNAWSLLRQSVGNFTTYSLAAVGLGSPAYSWQEVSIRNSIAAFYSALAAGKPVPVGAVEGTAVVEACELLFDSAMRTRERMRETDVGEKERVALWARAEDAPAGRDLSWIGALRCGVVNSLYMACSLGWPSSRRYCLASDESNRGTCCLRRHSRWLRASLVILCALLPITS